MAERLSDILGKGRPSTLPQKIGAVRLDEVDTERQNKVFRFGKQLTNIFSKSAKEAVLQVGGEKIFSWVAAAKLNKELKSNGIEAPSLRETRKRVKLAMRGKLKEEVLPEFRVAPAETIGENAVDIAAGLAGFLGKLAVLKRVSPGLSGAALWEAENLISGGTPGVGAATHGVFSLPGKAIKGVGIASRVGRVAAQSAVVGGLNAAKQKVETGEIKAKEVLISAGIGLVMGTLGERGAKARLVKELEAKNPKVIGAVNEALGKKHPKGLNKAIEEWSKKGINTNKETRGLVVHKFRQRQSADVEKAYKAARARGLSPSKANKIAGKARAGKADINEMEPLVLSPQDKITIENKIESVYNKKPLTRTKVFEVVERMEKGIIPAPHEFGFLEPILGTKTVVELYKNTIGSKSLELWDIPTLVRDVPKALRFGFDPQAARGLSKITMRHPVIYLDSLGKNIRGAFSKKYADKVTKTIEEHPAYKIGTEYYGVNYLSSKPWSSAEVGNKLEQYGNVSSLFSRSNNKVLKGIGTWLHASERGANLGMNSAFNKLIIKSEKSLIRYGKNKNLSQEQVSAWRKRRGHDINIFTKRITMKHPKGKAVQKAANWIVFSPSYTAAGLVSGPQSFLKLATGKGFSDRTYGMQIMLSRLVGITAVSSAIGYAGYKQRLKNPTEEPNIDSSPNPLDPLFGKIRQGNEVYDMGFGDIAEYRLMARIGMSVHLAAKKLRGEEVTSFRGKKVPSAGEAFGRYLESKRTLYLSLGKQLLSGKDWLGNTVSLKDTALDNLPFEFFQAFVEAGEIDGVWADMADGAGLDESKKLLKNLAPSLAALGGVGTASYPVRSSSTRSKFKDIIAKKQYGKAWNDLTQREQRRLSFKNRKKLANLDRLVKKENVDKPYRPGEEKMKSSKKIRGMLSKDNKTKVEGVSVGVTRRPKNFQLNDARYQKYQERYAFYLNESLTKLNLENKRDSLKTKLLEMSIKRAKNKAYKDVRKDN